MKYETCLQIPSPYLTVEFSFFKNIYIAYKKKVDFDFFCQTTSLIVSLFF